MEGSILDRSALGLLGTAAMLIFYSRFSTVSGGGAATATMRVLEMRGYRIRSGTMRGCRSGFREAGSTCLLLLFFLGMNVAEAHASRWETFRTCQLVRPAAACMLCTAAVCAATVFQNQQLTNGCRLAGEAYCEDQIGPQNGPANARYDEWLNNYLNTAGPAAATALTIYGVYQASQNTAITGAIRTGAGRLATALAPFRIVGTGGTALGVAVGIGFLGNEAMAGALAANTAEKLGIDNSVMGEMGTGSLRGCPEGTQSEFGYLGASRCKAIPPPECPGAKKPLTLSDPLDASKGEYNWVFVRDLDDPEDEGEYFQVAPSELAAFCAQHPLAGASFYVDSEPSTNPNCRPHLMWAALCYELTL